LTLKYGAAHEDITPSGQFSEKWVRFMGCLKLSDASADIDPPRLHPEAGSW